MKLLLDTHIFLWWITGDSRLSSTSLAAIRDTGNKRFLSTVSVWECLVKHSIGKLPLPHPPDSYLLRQRARHGLVSLPLDEESVGRLPALPSIHRDPFDRMLVCQATHHGMSFVTDDSVVRSYPVPCIA